MGRPNVEPDLCTNPKLLLQDCSENTLDRENVELDTCVGNTNCVEISEEKGDNSLFQNLPIGCVDENLEKGTTEETNTIEVDSLDTQPPVEIVIHNTTTRETGIFIDASIYGKELSLLIDSGADVTIISSTFVQKLESGKIPNLEKKELNLVSASGDPIPYHGECEMPIKLGKHNLVHKVLVGDIRYDGILGLDFMTQHSCDILVKKMCLRVKGKNLPCHRYSNVVLNTCCRIAIQEDITVPPCSELIAPGRALGPISNTCTALVEPNPKFVGKYEIFIARELVNPCRGDLPIRLMNISDDEIKIHKNSIVAHMEEVETLNVGTQEVETLGMGTQNVGSIQIGNPDTQMEELELPEHLFNLFQESSKELGESDKIGLKNLLLKYRDSFSKSSQDMGLTDIVEHQIFTQNVPPIKQVPRRIPLAKMDDVDREIKDMLDKGVIEESDSPWSSPIVLVKKKDNTLRFCIDYRKLNEVTLRDSHPIPRIDTTLDALSGSKYYSTVDLKSGYWQVKVAEQDRAKTAFSIPGGGHWQFVTMPFGLCNAPATFERLMERILAKLSWKICMVYLDDIIIMSATIREHLENLDQVFSRLREANLKMNPKKCKLLQKKVTYLGYIISENGIGTDPEKISAVENWPTPSNLRDVRSFLGLCSYYRKFVGHFADIAKPLHKLTQKNHKFEWTTDCQEAFDKLKRALTSSPILSYPQPNGKFILDTDASNFGMGAVLSQIQEGQEKVISYFSKTFSATEKRYCVTRRELLAIVQACKHFHHYLYGQEFKIRTDHGSLRWLLKFKNPEGQIARWIETLSSYQFLIEHRAGRSHQNADALSRRPCIGDDCKHCLKVEDRFCPVTEGTSGTQVLAIQGNNSNPSTHCQPENDSTCNTTQNDIHKLQVEDPNLLHVLEWVKSGIKPQWAEISHLSETCKYYWVRYDSFFLDNNVLYHKWEDVVPKHQLVIPKQMVNEVINSLHNSPTGGHLGMKKTLSKIRDRYFWHKMSDDVKHWCRTCDKCEARKAPNKTPKAALQKYVVGAPMERLAIDVMGPLPLSNKRNSYILVVGDYFTKWTDAIPMRNQTATTIAQKLVDRVITIFGVPMQLHSDQGRSFESHVFKEMCRILGIDKTRTTPYRPQSDGMIERANRTIISMLTSFVSENKRDWDEYLPLLMLAYHSSSHESTGLSPCEMVFGRPVVLPIDLVLGRVEPEIQEKYMSEYAYKLGQKLDKLHDFARKHISISSGNMIREYNTKLSQNRYDTGDSVWLFTPKTTKLDCQ